MFNNELIIGNNCLAGYLNSIFLNEKFFSPYVWGGMMDNEFFEFCEKYESIDISTFRMIDWEETNYFKTKTSYLALSDIKFEDNSPSYGIELSNGIQLIYPHHKTKEEIEEKFKYRRERLYSKNNLDVIFVFYSRNASVDDLTHFYELKTSHKKVLVVDDETLLEMFPSNEKTLVVFDQNKKWLKAIAPIVAIEMKKHFFAPKNKYNATICSIIKDEHLFLDEWIKYHLSIGFEKIFLYEDFTSKSHKDITDKYGDVVELHSMREIPNCEEDKTSRQCAVYNWFVENMGYLCNWCLFIDLDEFFRLENGLTLADFLSEFNDYHGIQVWWKVYGCGGHIKRPNIGVQEAYGRDFKPHVKHGITNYDYKSFVNMSKPLSFINCHYYRKIVNTHHKRGDFRYHNNELTWDKCWIDHYMSKSWEDWEARLRRGNITKGIRNVEYFFKINPEMRDKIDVENFFMDNKNESKE